MRDLATVLRYGALNNFSGPDAVRRAYGVGMWTAAAIFDNAPAKAWCAANGVPVQKAANEAQGSAGAFLVPADDGDDLVLETDPLRRCVVPAVGGVTL